MDILAKSLEDTLQAKPPEGDAQQRWDHLRDAIHGTAFSAFGRKQGKTQDLFEANATELKTVTEEKKKTNCWNTVNTACKLLEQLGVKCTSLPEDLDTNL